MPQNLICKAAAGEWCKTALGAGLERKQGKQWSDTHYGGIKWHFRYRSDDMHGGKKKSRRPAMVCWGRKSRKLPRSILWRRSCGGSPLLFKKIKLLSMGEKYFPDFQVFSKGHLQSCTPLKELSQKLGESVYMPWFQLCHLDILKTTSLKGFPSLILTFHQKVPLITMVQSNHYFAREFWQCAKAIKANLPIFLWSVYCKNPLWAWSSQQNQ